MATSFVYLAQAQSTFKPPLIANENAFLGDVASRYAPTLLHRHYGRMIMLTSELVNRITPTNPSPAASSASKKGTPLVYEYAYDEMKIILEGEFAISDESGQAVKARPGDVFYFPQGSRITFTTESGGLAFFVGFLFFFFPCSWVDIANIADRTTGSCMRGQFLPVG